MKDCVEYCGAKCTCELRSHARDEDPKVRPFFPWALFLVAAVLLMLASSCGLHAEEDIWACYGDQRYQAMSSSWPACTEMSALCTKVRIYLQTHTVEEGRAEAARNNLPQWLRDRAERCLK